MLAHPDQADTAGIAAILGGPAVYLLGTALFKWVTNTRLAAHAECAGAGSGLRSGAMAGGRVGIYRAAKKSGISLQRLFHQR